MFFIAIVIAVECSAALPTIATMITPTKVSVTPSECCAASTAPTRNSDIHATARVAPRSTPTALPTDHGAAVEASSSLPTWSSPMSASPPTKSCRCVTRENTSIAA